MPVKVFSKAPRLPAKYNFKKCNFRFCLKLILLYMTNKEIANSFSLLSKLIDINGGDSFKSKSYSSVAFNIEKLSAHLDEMPAEKISTLKGIGASSAKKITELISTGKLAQLEEMLFSTPEGVAEMLKIKGLGPKKINTIWKEMELESVGELLYACKENRLKLFPRS